MKVKILEPVIEVDNNCVSELDVYWATIFGDDGERTSKHYQTLLKVHGRELVLSTIQTLFAEAIRMKDLSVKVEYVQAGKMSEDVDLDHPTLAEAVALCDDDAGYLSLVSDHFSIHFDHEKKS